LCERKASTAPAPVGPYPVHTVTEQLGWEVWVENNEPKGMVFIVELPKIGLNVHDVDAPNSSLNGRVRTVLYNHATGK
jgi:hypothetical protein